MPSFTWQTVSFLFVPVPLLDKLESTDCTSEASASTAADGLSERFPKLPYKEGKSKALKQDTFKGQITLCKTIFISTLIKRLFSTSRGSNIFEKLLDFTAMTQEMLPFWHIFYLDKQKKLSISLLPEISLFHTGIPQPPGNPTTFQRAKWVSDQFVLLDDVTCRVRNKR